MSAESLAHSKKASDCLIAAAQTVTNVLRDYHIDTTPGTAGEPGSVQLSDEAVEAVRELGERLTATAKGHKRRGVQILTE